MTAPVFGNCGNCAAWDRDLGRTAAPNDKFIGLCRRFPDGVLKNQFSGCWSHIPTPEEPPHAA